MSALTLSPTLPAPFAAPSRPRLLAQLGVVAAVFAAALAAATLAGVRFAGPAAVICGALASLYVLRREDGGALAAIGLGRASPRRIALRSIGGMLLAYLAAGTAAVVATKVFGWAPMRTDALGFVRGDLAALLGMLAVAWTSAAIGEEVLFRGFLQGRLHALFGAGRGAGIAAAASQALLFGVAHAYQGPSGIVVTGAIGLVFGLLYLRARTLWPLVIAHGLVDTVGLLALYAAVAPR